MMPQVSTRLIANGQATMVLSVRLDCDGVEGDLNDYLLLAPDAQVPRQRLRLLQVWWSLESFDVTLKYGGLVPRPIWTFDSEVGPHVDFRHFGGVVDYENDPPTDDSSQVLISTNGFTVAGLQGFMFIEFRKL